MLSGVAGMVEAQTAARDYPTKPIRMVVPYVAGGGIDIIARTLGQKLSASMGQNVFVDNRGGAGGVIGTDFVAKAPPDGHTVLVTSSAHASLPSVMKSLPYDPVSDFAPISLVARSVGLVLVVHPSVPARSVGELVALARSRPGKLSYGTGGIGSVTHFAGELFNMMAGTDITHVPYKGLGQAIVDCLAGRIEVCFVAATAGVPQIRTDKLRAIGITETTRWNELMDVPTIEEAGVKGYSYVLWYGMWFPAATPAQHVATMRSEVVKAFEDPDLRRVFAEQGLIPVASTSQDFRKAIQQEIEVHRRLAVRIGSVTQ
jgi:tripartite-type tricarboxylate transporter receptor subunit TctC